MVLRGTHEWQDQATTQPLVVPLPFGLCSSSLTVAGALERAMTQPLVVPLPLGLCSLSTRGSEACTGAVVKSGFILAG